MPLTSDPLLTAIRIEANQESLQFPFTIPLIKHTQAIEFTNPVTFFVGENGTGKSTILEGMAHAIGFGAEGGSKNFSFTTTATTSAALGDCMKLTWSHNHAMVISLERRVFLMLRVILIVVLKTALLDRKVIKRGNW